jgi:lysophospholipase L1-like esterase
VAFGHSFTQGRDPWPNRVGRQLGVRLVVNHGVGGSESNQVDAEVEQFTSRRDDVVIVEAMLNDVRRNAAGGLARYRDNLARILGHLHVAKVVLIIDPPVTNWKLDPPYDHGNEAVRARYAIVTRQIAAAGGATVVDLSCDWRFPDISSDGVHPSETGTAHIARLITQAIITTNGRPHHSRGCPTGAVPARASLTTGTDVTETRSASITPRYRAPNAGRPNPG